VDWRPPRHDLHTFFQLRFDARVRRKRLLGEFRRECRKTPYHDMRSEGRIDGVAKWKYTDTNTYQRISSQQTCAAPDIPLRALEQPSFSIWCLLLLHLLGSRRDRTYPVYHYLVGLYHNGNKSAPDDEWRLTGPQLAGSKYESGTILTPREHSTNGGLVLPCAAGYSGT
jgi:hypothetical protein